MPRRTTPAALLLLGLAVPACESGGETYGFVATLGDDTTSVERITRTGNHIESDAIGRSPIVVRRQWEATLAPDGSVRRWSMHTHVPNASAGPADIYHEAVFEDSVVRLYRRTGGDSSRVAYRQTYAVTVPWNAFLYGTYELLFNAAQGLPDTTRIGQYFFEGWSEGNIGWARLRRLAGDSLAIISTGLSGAGIAHIDADGRLQTYNGAGTTYKQDVRRIRGVPDIDAIAARFAADEAARGVNRALSTRDTTRATVDGVALDIDYSRPLARGRALVGGLIPYGQVWRTGANAATQITVSAPVEIGGMALDSGTYTLWTLPAADGVQLIVNRQTGQWGTQYGPSHDIARIPARVDTLTSSVEQFTIRVDTLGATGPRLALEWGTFRWSVPVSAAPRR